MNFKNNLKQKVAALKAKLGPRWQEAKAWLSFSFERTAILTVVGIGLILSLLILTMEKGSSSSEHEEEQHGEHGHEEEGVREVELSDDAVESSGIKIEAAGKANLQRKLRLSGRVVPNRDRYTIIKPRFSGVIKRVNKDLGDKVDRGDTLAVVESNSARAAFEVQTGIAGVVIERQAIAGAFAPESEPIFKVADLSSVWVEVYIPDRDFNSVKIGQSVKVRDSFANAEATVTVNYISPVVYEDTQSLLLRAEVPNTAGIWKVGSFVDAEITVQEVEVPVAVKADAVQKIENETLVFVRDGEHFLAKPVAVGLMSKDFAEIKSGIDAGESYASANSFIVKAELLKSSAGHEH